MQITMLRSYKGSYGLLEQGQQVSSERIGKGECQYLISQGHAKAVAGAKAGTEAKKAEAEAKKQAKAK